MGKKFYVFSSMFLLILLTILTGCTKQESLVIATILPGNEEIIRDIFIKNYDNKVDITIKSIFDDPELVGEHWTDLDVVISEYLEKNKDVDIVYGFPPEYLKGLAASGNLKNLSDTLDENFLSHLAPAMLEPIKKAGEGNLYALTPSFTSYVLAYNKDIFEEIDINTPQNNMKWTDVSILAEEIQEKSSYKGIALGLPSSDKEFYYLYQYLSRPIYEIQNQDGKAIVNNSLNNKYWPIFSKLYKESSKADHKQFMNGKVAMAVFPAGSLTDENFYSNFNVNKDDLKLGLVELPIFEENVGGLAYSESLFSISKYSSNEKESLKFLEFVHNKENAKILANNSILPTYWDNDILQIFEQKYNLDFTPIFNQPGELLEKPQFEAARYIEIQSIGADYFTTYLNNKGNIDDVLINYEKDVNK